MTLCGGWLVVGGRCLSLGDLEQVVAPMAAREVSTCRRWSVRPKMRSESITTALAMQLLRHGLPICACAGARTCPSGVVLAVFSLVSMRLN